LAHQHCCRLILEEKVGRGCWNQRDAESFEIIMAGQLDREIARTDLDFPQCDRRRKNLRCVTIELRETEIDWLIRRGLLNTEMRNDLVAVRDALPHR